MKNDLFSSSKNNQTAAPEMAYTQADFIEQSDAYICEVKADMVHVFRLWFISD